MANAREVIGPTKMAIGAGLKLGQLTDLIGKGFQAGGTTIPYAGVVAAAAWLANSFITGTDFPDENYGPRTAMQGAGALMSLTPAWPVGLALGLGSMLIGSQPYDKPRVFLEGGETVKWGDAGLGGFEGIVYPEFYPGSKSLWDNWPVQQPPRQSEINTYSELQSNPNALPAFGPYAKGEDYIKSQLAKPKYGEWGDLQPQKTYEELLAEYQNWNPNLAIAQGDTYLRSDNPYTWGGIGNINPEDWVYRYDGSPFQRLATPVQSEKYGEISSAPDIWSQGGMWLAPSAGGSSEWARANYGPLKDTMNRLTQSHIDIFNKDIMEYMDTLPADKRAEMLGKLQNTDFNIDYTDLKSVEFTGDDSAMKDFMLKTSRQVSNQLMDQAVKIGIPRSAFMADSTTATNQSGGSAMPNNTDSTLERRYLDFASQQQNWNPEWNKYKDQLVKKLQNPDLDVTAGEGGIPQQEWQKMADFATTIPGMRSGEWGGQPATGGGLANPDPGQPSTGSANSQQQLINQYIEGYDWNDYWNRLEQRAGGLQDLYGNMSGRLEDVLQARQDSFQQTDPMYLGLTSDTLADYNALKDEYASLKQSSPDIGVSLGGQSMLNMGQRLGSKRNLLDNIARQTTLRQSALEGLTGSRDSFLGGWKSDLGDITSMYQAGLNAPLTSYQEMSPNVARWEGYGEAGVQRDWLAQQAALDRENQRAVANIASERGGDSWASILAAIGAGGGGIAKLLGMDTGGGNNLLGSIAGGLKGIGGGIGDLFGGGGWDDYSWADGLTNDDISALMGDIGSSGFEDWGSWNFDDLWY
uniref:Uncharacterized protein n=2 Tax=viral metagenome TaxID=1070528 RepID=A0A6M3X8M1_9ZZZZ